MKKAPLFGPRLVFTKKDREAWNGVEVIYEGPLVKEPRCGKPHHTDNVNGLCTKLPDHKGPCGWGTP